MNKIINKNYHYALLDTQVNQIISAGFNSKSKNVVRNSLIDFLLLGNFSEEGENSIEKNTLSELMNYYGFKLLASKSSFKSLIQKGLYQPMKVSSAVKGKWKNEIELSEAETEKVFDNNPQSHKEAGFEKGWPSRFDTWFKIAKELGFVWYWPNEEIKFSESGKMLLDKEKPENELMVFANAFAKYQRQNPFRRVLNKNVPLILLIQTIKLLDNDPAYNGTGISRLEIPLLLCWQNDNAESLYREIKKLRKKHGYSPSNEVILDICYELLNETKRDDNSILGDYPDDFIRKMRLTGLFSLRGGGRFIDINTKEIATVNYILKNYISYPTFEAEKDYFNYIGKVDTNLIVTLSVYETPVRTTKAELEKWVNHYAWESIKTEMLNLAQKKSSEDDILRVIEQPLRLEFLTSNDEQASLKDEYKSADKILKVRKYLKSENEDLIKSGTSNIFAYESGSLSANQFYGAKNISQAKLGKLLFIPELSKTDDNFKMSGPSPLRNMTDFVMQKVVKNSPTYSNLQSAFETFNKDFKEESSKDGFSLNELTNDINKNVAEWGINFGLDINTITADNIIKNLVSHYVEDKQLNDQRVPINFFGQGLQRHLIYTLIRVGAKYIDKKQDKKKEFSPNTILHTFSDFC